MTLKISSSHAFQVQLGELEQTSQESETGHHVVLSVPPHEGRLPLAVSFSLDGRTPRWAIAYTTNEDARPRPLPSTRLLRAWARPGGTTADAAPLRPVREQLTGNWERGRRVFYGEQTQCSKCHSAHDRAGAIGPSLANLWQRDAASVERDIRQPSFAIHPDFLTYVESASDWPAPEQLARADVLVFYQRGQWDGQRAAQLDAFLQRGGGAVFIHYAVDGGSDPGGFAERIGLAWQGGHSRFRHGALDVDFREGAGHPIARNFQRVGWIDESYWQLVGDPQRIRVLGTGGEQQQPQPLFWTRETESGGRIVVSIVGHYSWTFDDPLFRSLLLRSIAWSAREEADRFGPLVLFGARVGD